MIRWGYILLSVMLLFSSCDNSTDVEPEFVLGRDPKQVTLMYLAGITLETYFNTNIVRAKSAIANGDMGEYGAFYYFKSSSSTAGSLVELSYDGKGSCISRVVAEYDDITSLSKAGFMRVIADVKSDVGEDVMAQAQMNLIWGSHGTGWLLSQSGTQSVSSSVVSAYSGNSNYVGEYIPTRFLGLSTADYEAEGYMDIEDMRQAIEESDTHFGYILFDSCLMSSIEVLYRLRECCDYFVASPAEVVSWGFPYATVLPELYENNGTTYDLQGVCEAYYNYYVNSYATVAVCVSAELEGLATAMSSLTLSELSAEQLECIQSYDTLSNGVFYDFLDYVTAAGADGNGNYKTFVEQFDVAFPVDCRLYTLTMLSNFRSSRWSSSLVINSYSGVSTTQPSLNSTYNTGWSSEPWAVAIGAGE